ncbi:MAG TPA: PHP domain-containing protein [Candidatus Aminicenantes bacterium]|nr:PHP domain-containing protein [Candidatus Aminicenantes bacterium]HRY66013.1 PHP domain-containing protein [Candidatus Aminicenantes bacterium]HRZ72938.1 PHP domain-containing protein [Candidatus Aminicenantes bacterium]
MFTPLRLHSVFSRGQGSVTLEEAAAWTRGRRLAAAALTDVGNIYGWGKWKRLAPAAGLRPLFGCELGIGGRRLVFLVKTQEGYPNLMEIFNRREVRDASGLVAIYVPEGEAKASSPPGRPNEAAMLADLREKLAPGDLYLGAEFANFRRVMGAANGDTLQEEDGGHVPISGKLEHVPRGLPVVWANPVKYLTSPERLILLHAIEDKVPFPPERDRLLGQVGLFGPDQEALALRRFGEAAKDALARTFDVAGKCSFVFENVVPSLPADLFSRTLRQVVTERLAAAPDLTWKERQRARRELAAVEQSGFGPYFLVVHDIVEFARRRGILHNLRGSGASSFLAWLLGLSHVNPLEFDLYFERFLNRGRPDPPDIDIDFDSRRRDEVLAYVLERYGTGKTGAAYVCSLKDFGGRSALYETLRAYGAPPEEARSQSKRVPYFAEPSSLRLAAPAPGRLEAWKLAADLQDVYHEISLHVGGVILTPGPVERCLPLETSAKGLRMTHFDKDAVEDLRLIKLDLLSVRGLAAISETKEKLRLGDPPPGDPAAYAALRAARTVGCFQVESPAMMNLLRRMKPADIHEITQALALVRPGPTESGMKEALLRRRGGRRGAARPGDTSPGDDPFLARILPETGGILLYEEQVMQIAERAAGLPPEEGDLLRRSLKKGRGGDPALRAKFVREAGERGYAAPDVQRLWRTMEKFSSYSFNKAHSASYAAMAYQAVFLKVHQPAVYFTAVLNAGGGYYDLAEYVAEAKRNGLRLLGPDANRSAAGFEVEDGAIRVGLASIKGLGFKTIERLLDERAAGGEYLSVEDFLARMKPGRAELLTLIKAGVFDSLEPRRTRQVLRYFRGLEHMEEVADIASDEKRRMLFEALGFLPEGDDLELYQGKRPDLRVKDLKDHAGAVVELVVRVVDARQRVTYPPQPGGSGRGGYAGCGGYGGGAGRRGDDEEPGPLEYRGNGGAKYFYMFEDETGLLEGVGETRCAAYGTPPVCFLRGQVRKDGEGVPKITGCAFLRSF